MIQPIVIRELTAVARSAGYRRDRWWIGVAGFALFGLAVIWAQLAGGGSIGAEIFQVLAWILWIFCVVLGATMTANTISRERRDGTLGLLFLTPMSAWDVTVGKLTSGATTSVYRLLTLTPMLACCLLLGGIMGLEVLAILIVCLNALFLSLAFGLFISSTQTDDRVSSTLTVSLLLVWALVPYLGESLLPPLIVPGFGTVSPYLVFSTAFPVKTIASGMWMGGFRMTPVVSSVIFQHAIAWALLVTTGFRLRHVALANPPRTIGSRWRRLREWWLYGSARSRIQCRRRLLAVHPMVWLGLRQCRKPLYVWLMFGLIAAVFATTAILLDDPGEVPTLLAVFVFLSLAVLKVWLISETCTRLVEDRSSGALELILTTPTSAREWIHGQASALKRLFLRPTFMTAGVVVAIAGWHLFFRTSFEQSNGAVVGLFAISAVALLDLRPLFWVSIWEALVSSSANAAFTRVLIRIMLPAYLMAFVGYLVFLWIQLNRQDIQVPSPIVLWIAWLALNAVIDWLLVRFARPRALSRFRENLAPGVSAKEKKSEALVPAINPSRRKPKEILGWWIVQHPLVALMLAIGLVISGFIGIRNELWDRRVAVAQGQMWLPGIPRQLPAASTLTGLNSPAAALAVQDLLAEARLFQQKRRGMGGIGYPYVLTNRAKIEALLQPSLALANYLLAVPKDAHFPRTSVATDPWGNQQFPSGAICDAATDLSIRLQWAVEAGDGATAMKCFRAIGQANRLLEELPSPMTGTYSARVAANMVDCLHRWLNTKSAVRPDLTEVSALLEQADSWAGAQRRLRTLPAFLDLNHRHPFELTRGPEQVVERALDLLTASGRKDAEMAFREARSVLDAVELPEQDLIERVSSTANNRPGNYLMATFSHQSWNRVAFQGYLMTVEAVKRIRLARAAVIVEEFRLREGRLPQDQSEVGSLDGRSWPRDPVSGSVLGYALIPGGYRITAMGHRPKMVLPNSFRARSQYDPNVFDVRTAEE